MSSSCLLKFFMPHHSLCLQFILSLATHKHQLYFNLFLVILYLYLSSSVLATCFSGFPERWVFRHTMFLCGIPFSSVCLQSYWFSPPRTLILEVCSATSSGCTMLIHLLSEISLAMHIWQLLYLVIFFNPSMRRSSLMPSQMLAGLPLSPQLKSQGLVSFSLKKVCTTSPFFSAPTFTHSCTLRIY